MDHPYFTAFILVAGLIVAAVAQWRGWRPSLWTTLAVGVVLRLVLLVFAATDSFQPVDFNEGFRHAGRALLHHQDPVLATQGSWHFLPMIPYFYALALATGLPWEVAGRVVHVRGRRRPDPAGRQAGRPTSTGRRRGSSTPAARSR